MNTPLPMEERELLQLLNWELAAYEECEDCRFTAITKGNSGWEAHLEGGAVTGQMIAQQVVAQTRRSFNLARH